MFSVLTVVSTVAGIAVGTAGASARTFGPKWLGSVVAGYVEVIRNTPFIVQLFFIFFGLPSLGVRLTPEIARAGIEGTPRGQIEAARSLALSERQVFIRVVLPPALARVWPAMVSQIVIVMLGSAVCGQIAAQELSYYANLIQSRNFRAFEAFIVATAIYLALSIALRHLLNWIGPKWLFGRMPNAGR